MGSTKNVYVGPYFDIIKIPAKKVEKKDSYKTCLNEDCQIHLKKSVGEFCSNCGSRNVIKTNTKFVDDIKSVYQIMDEFGQVDLLFYNDEILMPNRRNKYSKHDDDPFLLNMDENYISNALESFKKDYSKFTDYLKDNGIEFDIKFGVDLYYW